MGGKSSNVGTCSVRVERRKRIAIFKPGGREEEEEKNIFEAKNARVGKRATLISLVYGVAFCLINTPLVNHPCTGVLPILHSLSLSLCVCRHFILFFFSLSLYPSPLFASQTVPASLRSLPSVIHSIGICLLQNQGYRI